MNKMRPQINRHTTKLVLQMKRTQYYYVLHVSEKFSKICKHQKGVYCIQCVLIINKTYQYFCKYICLWGCCSREYTAREPIWMSPCVNVSLKCVIPEQLGSCVWWREPGFIIASTGDSMRPERERQTETEREKEGGGETPYWQHEWYIIWLSWTELFSLTAYTALSNRPLFHKPWWTDLLHSTKPL